MMISKFIRLIISAVLLIGAVALFFTGSIGWGVWLVLFSALMVLFHFKNEMNLLAFAFVRFQKMPVAGVILSKVRHPENMIAAQEAYYYFLSGLVASAANNQSGTERNLKKALSVGLRLENDQAMANLALSGLYMARRNKKVATIHLKQAKKLDKMKLLAAQVKEMENVMKRM